MARHAFQTVLVRCFVTLLMLIQSSLWTRMLAPEGRGLYAKLQASQNFLVLFLGFGITSGVVYFCSSRRAEAAQLWTLSIVATVFGCIVTGAMILVGHFWNGLNLIFPAGYESVFIAIYFWFIFIQSQLQLSMNSFLAAYQQFTSLNQIEVWTMVFRLMLVTTAFIFFKNQLTIEILLALDFAAHTIKTAFFMSAFSRLKIRLKLGSFSFNDAKPVLLYSFTLYSLYVIQFLYQRIDIWIIERWSGLAALGIFSCAVGLAQYLTILPIALNTVLMPHMSRTSPEEAYTNVAKFSRINSTLLLAPVLVFTLFPYQVLVMIFGSAFGIGANSLRVLALAYWFTAAKHIFIYFNASRARLHTNFMIEAVGLALGLALNFLWVPHNGIEGAAYAFLATGVITSVLSFLSVQRFADVREKNFVLLTLNDIKGLKQSMKFRN